MAIKIKKEIATFKQSQYFSKANFNYFGNFANYSKL